MRRSTALVALILSTLVTAPVVAFTALPSGAALQPQSPAEFSNPNRYAGKDLIVVMGIGEGQNKSTKPNAFDITVPLVSAATRQVIGTVRHEPQCADDAPPCFVLKDQDTYDLGNGTIVTKSRVTFEPDADNPGFSITKSQPTVNNIVSATGAYAGRTGQVRVYGYVDTRKFPASFILDEVYMISLDPS